MLKKMRRGLAAGMLAVVVTLPGGAQPAQAVVDPATVIAVAQQAYALWKEFKGGDKSLEQATQQIIASIESAKTAILSRVDLLAAAEARACARHAVVELADIGQFDAATMRSWAQDVTGCVTLIDSLAATVTDQSAIDQLGFAVNSIGPIALVARARAGFSTQALTAVLVGANNTVATKIDPPCVQQQIAQHSGLRITIRKTCTAGNGDSAFQDVTGHILNAPNFVFDTPRLKTEASRNTSKPLAISVVPLLSAA
ncbi:hypothetical protein DMB66_53715 [Actinoplanes sp. ATCC 53533]|uniref:hypothetical protein n=1 Tax=Actinoplanes sp. ATCC 53533 TaxID=1288362 RepID=UPI000F783951|nr:hypothetical protein [Actinoplanes sp. ATCC 53533]RSM43109.1 hypothetical protein DMB66_53715 [Actinoplanes sp. ATCC 53533]